MVFLTHLKLPQIKQWTTGINHYIVIFAPMDGDFQTDRSWTIVLGSTQSWIPPLCKAFVTDIFGTVALREKLKSFDSILGLGGPSPNCACAFLANSPKMHILNSERTHVGPKLRNYWGPHSSTFDIEWLLQRYMQKKWPKNHPKLNLI